MICAEEAINKMNLYKSKGQCVKIANILRYI